MLELPKRREAIAWTCIVGESGTGKRGQPLLTISRVTASSSVRQLSRSLNIGCVAIKFSKSPADQTKNSPPPSRT